jgi:class 3 adenylate cyclase/tetratricopeptide (TPR) repeat protein
MAVGEVRKTVTVLFSDVCESTSLGERLDPESVRRVMTRYFDEMRAALEHNGGTVEKFIGDAVMAVFGIPAAHEDDALRAVRAADEMGQALARLNQDLEREHRVKLAMRIGINTGEVVAGDASVGPMLVTGKAVNVAARLQQAAEPGSAVIGELTYRLVQHAVRVEPGESLVVRGVEGGVTAFRLLGLVPRVVSAIQRLDAPLVDREHELSLLSEALERTVSERACRLLTLIGAPGVGKSRLVAETIAANQGRASALVGRCVPYGEGITYRPVVEAVWQAADLVTGDSPAVAHEKIGRLLESAGQQSELVADRIAQVIGIREGRLTGEEAFWAVRRFFEAIAAREPLLLVLEDVHWAEPTLLDLVEYIANWSEGVPILLVCLARPELLTRRLGFAAASTRASSAVLAPLSIVDSGLLIDHLLGGAELSADVRTRILETADGNPLFVEQMLAFAVEGRADEPGMVVPPTIQALLAARLDALPPGERALIERASVMGQHFLWEAVHALSPDAERERVSEHLMTLVRKEFIQPVPNSGDGGSPSSRQDHRLGFRHILIRDAAYDGMPKQSRADLHERFADWLEEHYAEHEEIAGYHLERSFRYRTELHPVDDEVRELGRRAGERLGSAGRRAFARGDMAAAANLLDRAVSLLAPASDGRLGLLPLLGRAVRETGDLARADRILTATVAAAAAGGNRRVEGLALIEQSTLREYTDRSSRTDEVERLAQSLISMFTELDDQHGLVRAWSLLGDVHWTRCHFAAMEEVLERGLVHARRTGDVGERNLILGWLSRAALLGPMHVGPALERCAAILLHGRNDPQLEAFAGAIIGGLAALVGRFDEAREALARSRGILEEFGFRLGLATLPLYAGPAELLAGDPIAAERYLRAGYESLREMGELGRLSTEAAFLAQALYAQERYSEAEHFTTVCLEAATPDDAFSQIAWRGVRAKTLARRAEFPEAEALAREGVRLAAETDALNLHGDALLDLAEVLALGGLGGDHEAADQALVLYNRKGNLVSAAAARAAMGSVSSP